MEHIATSAKGIAAAGLFLISPIVLLFLGPVAFGVSSDIVRELGAVPTVLGLSAAVALFALYKLQYPN